MTDSPAADAPDSAATGTMKAKQAGRSGGLEIPAQPVWAKRIESASTAAPGRVEFVVFAPRSQSRAYRGDSARGIREACTKGVRVSPEVAAGMDQLSHMCIMSNPMLTSSEGFRPLPTTSDSFLPYRGRG